MTTKERFNSLILPIGCAVVISLILAYNIYNDRPAPKFKSKVIWVKGKKYTREEVDSLEYLQGIEEAEAHDEKVGF
ncbi:hypothetical protein ACVW0P_001431 [Mucilaginibacter sp. UYNi724]